MRRHQAKRARRAAAGQRASTPTDIPLPVRGVFVEARHAKVNGIYAAELLNFQSTGTKLRTAPGVEWQGDSAPIMQRIPFEVGSYSRYIEVLPNKVICGAHEYQRTFSASAMAAKISDHIILFDGVSQPIKYNGLTFSIAAFNTNSGAEARRLDGVIGHHDRIFAWQSNGPADFWYGDVGAVGGALTRYPMSRLGNIRGSIIAMQSLTVDAGEGMNDVLAIFTNRGQIIVYEGLNPGDVEDWHQTARVEAAQPLSKFAFAKVGADVWMVTPHGVVSVLEAIRSSVLALVSDFTQPIADLMQEWIEEGPAQWRMEAADDGSMVVINRHVGVAARQLVFWTKARAWGTTNYPARDLHNLGGQLTLTGADGRLGVLKRRGSGVPIKARWVSSWFSAGGSDRTIHYIEPVIRALAPLDVRLLVLTDFNTTAADMTEAEQIVRILPEEPGSEITLSDKIAVDASGSDFQLILEISAEWAEIISLKAAIG